MSADRVVTSIEAFFERLYRRTGTWYLDLLLFSTGLTVCVVTIPAQHLSQFPLWGEPSPDWAALGVFCGLGTLISLVALAGFGRRAFHTISLHLRGKEVAPEEVWSAVVRALPRIAVQIAATFWVLGIVPGIYVAARGEGFTPWTYVGAFLAESMITFSNGIFFYLVFELAFRPILRDITPLLPADFDPGPRWLTLDRRVVIATTSVMLLTGAAVSGVASGVADREGRLLVVLVATLGVVATFAGALTGLVQHSVVTRVHDLKVALGRVGDGSYDVRLPPGAGDELDLLHDSFNEMAGRLQNHHLDLRESRARLASVTDDERRRMERDLRVGVQARLALLDRQLAALPTEPGTPLAHEVDVMRSQVDMAVQEITALAHGIYPAALESDGLEAALLDAGTHAPLPVVVTVGEIGRLRRELESAVYFTCSEALQNAAKHAGPDATVTIEMHRDDDRLSFSVTDDGAGFDGPADGHGVTNMRDRIRALGGELTFSSSPGDGTRLSARVPLD